MQTEEEEYIEGEEIDRATLGLRGVQVEKQKKRYEEEETD
jgi:hypothetical protein